MQRPTADLAVLIVNTICTLKCRHCITRTPYQKNPQNFSMEGICADLDALFTIYSSVGHIDLEGGETLLHPDIAEVIGYAYTYVKQGRCGEIRLLTNGTLLPSDKLLSISKECDAYFIVDDYGENLSRKVPELKSLLDDANIRYRIDVYHGENQYYGGWIDFGDFSLINESESELRKKVELCRSSHGLPYVKDGKVFLCQIHMAGMEHIELIDGEYIDLRDSTRKLEDKIRIAHNFGKQPTNACRYCKGFITTSKRISAAEQISEKNTILRNCE